MLAPSSQLLSIIYSLLVTVAVALPMDDASSTAQQAPYVAPLISTTIDASFRSGPVMFIENAGQWPGPARFQVWGAPANALWLAEDTAPPNPTVSLIEAAPNGCVQLTPVNTSVKLLQEDRYQVLECPYLTLESVEDGLFSAIEDVPQPPLLISPADEERLGTLLPVLQVNTDISGAETSVRYEYSVNSDFSPGNGGMGVAGPRTVPEWSFQLGSGWAGYNLQPNTRYYWHARTGYGNWRTGPIYWGPYSPTWSFTTGADGTILPGPELVSPSNNSDVYALRPILQWHTLAGARGFFVQASPVGGGPGYLWFSEDLPGDKVGFWTDLPQNSSWDWKVRLRNDYAWGDLSSVWRFTVRLATISGRVTDASGAGIPGVIVWAGFPRNTTTDANGNYTFTGLPAGTYTIRPEKVPYSFSPASVMVTVPPDRSGVDFTRAEISKIEINQALGNTSNYVAGKITVVRVFLTRPVANDPLHQRLVIRRNDGSVVAELTPQRFAFSSVLTFQCGLSQCDYWKPGQYTFEALVNGSQLSKPATFLTRQGMKILVVPVKVGDAMPSERWEWGDRFLVRTYPVAENGVAWIPGATLDASDLNLADPEQRRILWERLAGRRVGLCGAADFKPCYDKVIGVIPEMDELGGLGGWTYGPAASVVVDTQEMEAIVAHEVGHFAGASAATPVLGDEYQGGRYLCDVNSPPASYCGKDGTADQGIYAPQCFYCSDSNAQAWQGVGTGSTVRAVEDAPYDVIDRGPLSDKLSFMGSGAPQEDYWVTPDVYNQLFHHLEPASVQAFSLPKAQERVAAVSGWVTLANNAILEPIYHFLASPPAIRIGAYSVEVLDTTQQVIASQGFDVSFEALSNPPQDLDEAPFEVVVRLPDNARRLRVKRGATVLTEMMISAHVPTLSITSPTTGQNWAASGNYTIRWQGSDLDGDILHYTVLYRQDAGDWIVLGDDLTNSELTVDAAGLPGGPAAQVQVLVTDGINTTTAESGLFTVDRKGPKTFIANPAEGASFMPGVSFFLQGTAYDLEDGKLPDSAYRWTSNRDGDVGTGASNLVILTPGLHVITLTVTDSDGNTAVKTIRLSAGDRLFLPMVLRGQ